MGRGEPPEYGQIIEEFCQEYELGELEPPELKVDGISSNVMADPDEYAIHLGLFEWGELEKEETREELKGALKDFYNVVLTERVEHHTTVLEELYAPFKPVVAVDHQYFADLNKDNDKEPGEKGYMNGNYSPGTRTVKIDDRNFLKHMDLKTGEATNHDLEQTIRHESTHGLQFGTIPTTHQLRTYVRNDSDDYSQDVRRASLEAIARFEQHRTGEPSSLDKNYQQLHDPWKIPDVFAEHTAYSEHGLDLFDDPYNLGHFTAHAVDTAFQEKHGGEAGRRLTREFLLRCVTTPDGLTGAIEQSFYLRDLPYYPRLVKKWSSRLQRQETPVQQIRFLVEKCNKAERLYNEAETEKEKLRYFYEFSALRAAAQSHVPDEEFNELDENIESPD